MIVSDGAYGLASFPGEPCTPMELPDWYKPHLHAWNEHSSASTTLWFWNTELGWAIMHPIIESYGWEYVGLSVWNKGIAHIAGNCNTKTIRSFPTVTEVCAQYKRKVLINGMSVQDWLRSEWKRAGLPFAKANDACGVKNAASRKYLTPDNKWYFPPPEHMESLARYANNFGDQQGRPYFSIDGVNSVDSTVWELMRNKFTCPVGVTNVWEEPAVRGQERLKVDGKAAHMNQKPLKILKMIVEASSSVGDCVWEPFGGTCTAMMAAKQTGRVGYAAEINPVFYSVAVERLSAK